MLSRALEDIRDRRRGLDRDTEFWEGKLTYEPESHVAWDANEVHATLSTIRALALGYDELIKLGEAEVASRRELRRSRTEVVYDGDAAFGWEAT